MKIVFILLFFVSSCSIFKSRFDRCVDLLEATDGTGSLKIIENGKFKYYCGKEDSQGY